MRIPGGKSDLPGLPSVVPMPLCISLTYLVGILVLQLRAVLGLVVGLFDGCFSG